MKNIFGNYLSKWHKLLTATDRESSTREGEAAPKHCVLVLVPVRNRRPRDLRLGGELGLRVPLQLHQRLQLAAQRVLAPVHFHRYVGSKRTTVVLATCRPRRRPGCSFDRCHCRRVAMPIRDLRLQVIPQGKYMCGATAAARTGTSSSRGGAECNGEAIGRRLGRDGLERSNLARGRKSP